MPWSVCISALLFPSPFVCFFLFFCFSFSILLVRFYATKYVCLHVYVTLLFCSLFPPIIAHTIAVHSGALSAGLMCFVSYFLLRLSILLSTSFCDAALYSFHVWGRSSPPLLHPLEAMAPFSIVFSIFSFCMPALESWCACGISFVALIRPNQGALLLPCGHASFLSLSLSSAVYACPLSDARTHTHTHTYAYAPIHSSD